MANNLDDFMRGFQQGRAIAAPIGEAATDLMGGMRSRKIDMIANQLGQQSGVLPIPSAVAVDPAIQARHEAQFGTPVAPVQADARQVASLMALKNAGLTMGDKSASQANADARLQAYLRNQKLESVIKTMRATDAYRQAQIPNEMEAAQQGNFEKVFAQLRAYDSIINDPSADEAAKNQALVGKAAVQARMYASSGKTAKEFIGIYNDVTKPKKDDGPTLPDWANGSEAKPTRNGGIVNWLKSHIGMGSATPSAPPNPSPTPRLLSPMLANPQVSSDPMEGKTAINPQTGQRMIRREGDWQPL